MSLLGSELQELKEDVSASPLYNPDIAPTTLKERTWSMWNFAALWVAMSVCIPTYILASYMLKAGLGWLTAVAIILAGNIIVAFPMVLNAHAGTKYGIPFPVFGRSVFGVHGIHLPSILRGLVACGWFGIQCWVGGLAVIALGLSLWDPSLSLLQITTAHPWVPFLGFGLFWVINMYFVYAGTESIKWLENWSAPILLVIGFVLLAWAISVGGGLTPVLERANKFSEPAAVVQSIDAGGATLKLNLLSDRSGKVRATKVRFLTGAEPDMAVLEALDFRPLPRGGDAGSAVAGQLRIPGATAAHTVLIQFASESYTSANVSRIPMTAPPGEPPWLTILLWLAAMVGYWATLALNIPDISRYARSQKDQAIGQFLGLPTTMLLYSFIGVVATAAAIIAFESVLTADDAPWEPATLISQIGAGRIVGAIAQFSLIIATLSTNIAANVISPANSFANAWPKHISFRTGGLIAGTLGIVLMPWKLAGVIAGFLIGYGSVLGPVVAVMIADYYFVRRTELSLSELFKVDGRYHFTAGFNVIAIVATTLGAAIVLLSGNLAQNSVVFKAISYGAWFSGFLISMALYLVAMQIPALRARVRI